LGENLYNFFSINIIHLAVMAIIGNIAGRGLKAMLPEALRDLKKSV
jgi:hypothetical protein